jgi:ABC-type antimicrobial peptide transport system permease subunit
MLAGFGMGVGICIIGAFIPIFRVKKIEPLLAIREE